MPSCDRAHDQLTGRKPNEDRIACPSGPATQARNAAAACGAKGEEGAQRSHVERYEGTGAVRAEFQQRFNGKEWVHEGPARFYDEQGRLTHSGSYAAGLEEGLWQEFAPDGSLGEGPYQDGARSGTWTWYHPADDGARQPADSFAAIAATRGFSRGWCEAWRRRPLWRSPCWGSPPHPPQPSSRLLPPKRLRTSARSSETSRRPPSAI